MDETYEEVTTGEDIDDFEVSDYVFITFTVLMICVIFAFVIKTISKHFKNINLKIGKVEVGIESKPIL